MENVAVTGMEEFMTTLTGSLSAGEIWGVIAGVGGLIVIVTLVAVGRRVLNKNLSAIKNGKAGRI